MMHVVTAEQGGFLRIDASGANATVRIRDEQMQLLYIEVPDKLRGQGLGKELLTAAEEEAAAHGVKHIYVNYADNVEGVSPFFKACGYEVKADSSMLSISPGDLLSSAGVSKSLRMNFKDIQTEPLDELLMYQWEEVADFMRRYHYDVRVEDFDYYDPDLSWVAYDMDCYPRAVLLTTLHAQGVAIDLLFGFSKTKPQFILSVCQEFAKELMERMKSTVPEKIFIYSCTDFVMPLLRRLLDSKYEMATEYSVMKAQKEISGEGRLLERDICNDRNVWKWQKEVKGIFGQRNINEKAMWRNAVG